MVIGDWGWGLGIGDWGLGPIPNPHRPIKLNQKIKLHQLIKIIYLKKIN